MNREKFRPWLAILLMAAIVRLVTLGTYPLHDTTEARYAEVARIMVASSNWVTPQIEPGVPFWAKPPLSIWMTAGSFEIFGINEFAARLPAFLLVLLTIALVYQLGRKLLSSNDAVAASAILLTSGVGYVCAGAVMTDAALLFSTTLSLVAFWFAAGDQHKFWGYVFFVGLGLGLLAKGPLALVLVGIPVFTWSLRYRSPAWLLSSLPWLSGGLLMLAIAVPWYMLAENSTPGFLHYYFVGEHWLRFVDSGWAGDLYGNAHSRPWGTIWLFAIAGGLPWSLIAIYAAFETLRRSTLSAATPFQIYLLLWAAAPLIFFTFAANILPSYVLPGLPAFALLMSIWFRNRADKLHNLGWIIPIIVSVVFLTESVGLINQKTQKDLIIAHGELAPTSRLVYFPKLPYSASFYSNGQATSVSDEAELGRLALSQEQVYIAIRERRYSTLPPALLNCMEPQAWIRRFVLVKAGAGVCRPWARIDSDEMTPG